MWRKIAIKLKGWNSLEDIRRKLRIKKSTAYLYVHKLDKNGFVIQKVKKPRGTLYLISQIPARQKHYGMYEGSNLISPEIELSGQKIDAEHKIAFFLSSYTKEKNIRFYKEAKDNIRKIKSWKRLYRYLKAYNSQKEFKMLYIDCRKTVKKTPSIPKRYKKLLGV